MKDMTFQGDCTNSFDSDTGDSLIECFVDVSDFANKDENATKMSLDEFSNFVPSLPKPFRKKDRYEYFHYDGDIFVVYDTKHDIHCFWA